MARERKPPGSASGTSIDKTRRAKATRTSHPPTASRTSRPAQSSASTSGAAGPLPDLIRRVAAVGLSGFFTTEEAVRKALGNTVPKDWVDFAADQGTRARAELSDRLAEEFRRAVESTDLAEVIGELMAGRTLEIDARIRLVPDDEETPQRPKKRSSRTEKTDRPKRDKR